MTRPTPSPGTPTRPVRPSSTDPVNAWLDVLASMLSLPPDQRRTVRDELEDHLRSRIDDLLIAGRSEGEALRQAVAELGETADLARQITHAHANPRKRRFAMQALIIALAGTLIALGVNTMRPSSPVVAVSVGDAAPADPAFTQPLTVRDQTLGAVFEEYRERVDRPVVIHWPLLENIGLSADTPLELDADPLPANLIFRTLAERMEQLGPNSLTVLVSPELIEIGLRSQFDHRTMQRRTYDASALVGYEAVSLSARQASNNPRGSVSYSASEGVGGVAMLIAAHISPADWAGNGGGLARYSVMGNSIVITAPERIHAEVERMIAELAGKQQVALDSAREAGRTRWEALKANLDRLESEYAALFEQWEQRTHEQRDQLTGPDAIPDNARIEIMEFARNDLVQRMQMVRIRQSSLTHQLDELAREWELSEATDETPPESAIGADRVPPGRVAFLAIRSTESQPILLPTDRSLTLREVLASNGVAPDENSPAWVYLRRATDAPEDAYRVGVSSLFGSESADRVLQPGDRVSVSEHFRPL